MEARRLLGLLGLLGQEYSLDVGQDTSLGDGDAREKFVQLLVVADGELQVTGDDPRLLVVTSGVSCQLQDLSCQVLHDGGEVDGCTRSYALGIVALSEVTMNSTDWKLKSCTG